ncbi:DUF421 domain-containing protein [Loigolactobacillus rennini]|uniref:DUF421 domain-containing protein n=1 Tax=Loigolactobacillus rennini DSM 20253 TaxID=1423796 RepID=A0A0R2D1E7_9LACO|nr:DUF421 domain-containing protein [Loigolactobacillus rennini]KRM95684.1 hypothetical protein FC24_GL002056 [Loigolactobacillus rennini DSM 20253]
MFSYLEIGLKFALGLVCVIVQINLLGKGNLTPTSAIDQIQNYVLGGIIGGMIYNTDITLLQFFLILLIWTLIVLVVKFISDHNRHLKHFVTGEPHTIIKNGQILVNVATRFGLSGSELSLKLRTAGVDDLSKVRWAVLEQNGQLTVTMQGADSIRYPLIVDMVINPTVLELIGKDEAWVQENLRQQGYQLSDVYYATYRHQTLQVTAYPQAAAH